MQLLAFEVIFPMKTYDLVTMITLLKNPTLKITFAFFVAFAFIGSSASASFDVKQRQMFEKSSKDVSSMGKSLDSILEIYIGAEEDIHWNEPAIVEKYKNYISSLVSFNQGLDSIWSLSQKTIQSQRTRLKSVSKKGLCSRAQTKRNQASQSFEALRQSYQEATTKQQAVNGETARLASWILNEGSITDGHLDDAVYDFGTKNPIYAPPTGNVPVVDPSEMEPILAQIYDYSASTNPIYMSAFYQQMLSAIKLAKSC